MRNVFILLCVCLGLYADWQNVDRSNLQYIRDDFEEFLKYGDNDVSTPFNMSWYGATNQLYLQTRMINEAKEFDYEMYGDNHFRVKEINPFSNNNKTMFSQDDLANDETSYYQDYIFSFYPQNYTHSWSDDKPDASFLSAPASGNMMNRLLPEMDNNNLGINAIANSEQTSEIRGSLSLAEQSLDSMFNNQSYSNSVISWDFSDIGKIFVDRHIMQNNPFANLKGQFRLVPNQTDLHYSLWYNYFRDGSTYGNLIRLCANAFMFFMVLLYVVNDLMSIVDA